MRFYMPANVYVEKDCVQNHGEELASLGRKACIMTGRRSAAANGSLAEVTGVLEAAGIPYVVFNEVEENPSVDTIAKAAQIGIRENTDFVIGVGGGSALDAAKAVAVMTANPKETKDCLYSKKKLSAFPFAAVPTTCGTGSEVTPNAVLTRPEIMKKGSMSYSVFADLALVDGKYIASCSQTILVNTAVDALAHSIESYLHTKANDYNRMFSGYALKLWAKEIPFLLGEKEIDDEARELLMLTSTVAGMAIAQTGTSIPHVLSYDVTLSAGVPHGKACGLFLAAYMEEYAKNKPEDVQEILDILGFNNVRAFGVLLQRLIGIQETSSEEMEKMATSLAANTGKLATYPFEVSLEAISEIVRKSLVAV